MKCGKCLSNNLMHVSRDKSLYRFINNEWRRGHIEVGDVGENLFIHSSTEHAVSCLNCNFKFKIKKLENQILPKTTGFKEIVLDLDNTLICTEFQDYYGCDFSFNLDGTDYFVFNRPNLKEFLDFCCSNFDKVNFFTASTREYATNIINNLPIDSNKIGWVKTREDCVIDYSLISGEKEHMKFLEDCLIVDDRIDVYSGFNTILMINPFFAWNEDNELEKIINLINREEIEIIEKISLEVRLTLLRDVVQSTMSLEDFEKFSASDFIHSFRRKGKVVHVSVASEVSSDFLKYKDFVLFLKKNNINYNSIGEIEFNSKNELNF